MSRAFVKEPDGGPPEDEIPERRVSEHPNYVTPTGLAQLAEEIGRLRAERLRVAGEPEEVDAGERLAYLDRELRYFTGRLESAILGVDRPTAEVAFGAHVRVRGSDGGDRSFAIVGEDEADLASGKVSYVSPLAQALLGARVGDTVTWERPAGDLQLTVMALDRPDAP
jgi:transcription elongation factor GreB